jgi:hypothetical protein
MMRKNTWSRFSNLCQEYLEKTEKWKLASSLFPVTSKHTAICPNSYAASSLFFTLLQTQLVALTVENLSVNFIFCHESFLSYAYLFLGSALPSLMQLPFFYGAYPE